MSVKFNAERYLRILGETALAHGEPDSTATAMSALTGAAGALVAADTISSDAAQDILDGYEDALAMRSGSRRQTSLSSQRARRRASGGEVPRVGELRTITCDHLIERERWTLRLRRVYLEEEETSLRCEVHAAADGLTGPPSRGLVSIPVSDDRGTTAVLRFPAGSGSWTRELELSQVLALDTAWLEIESERVHLEGTRPQVSVASEPVNEVSPALRHLRHQVAIHDHYGGAPIDLAPAVDALLASGAISDIEVPDLLSVHRMLSAIANGSVPVSAGGRFPGPWDQMVARYGRDVGPVGTILVSTVLPPIDGISVAIREIKSYPSGFDVQVQCKPSLGVLTGHSWEEGERLAWWAADDHGNRYLGSVRQWVSHDHAGREDDSHATITFWPALDPTASRLEIIPTAERTRAVLGVALSWPPASQG